MRLLVTRPHDESLALAEELAARGHAAIVEPLLEIVWLPGPPVVADGVQAILFTSANGVRALTARNADLSALRNVPVVTVGDATARAAREAGFVHIESANGDVVALAERIAAICDPSRGELLHIAGSKTAGDLAGTLSAQGFTVRREVIYEAHKATDLSPPTIARLRQGEIDGALFFSPRTATAFVELIEAAGLAPTLGRVTAICLSRAVADAADTLPGAASWRDIIVAPQPTQESLFETLDRLTEREAAAPKGEAGPAASGEATDLPAVAAPAVETVRTVTPATGAGASAGNPRAEASRAHSRSSGRARAALIVAALLLLGGGTFAVVKSDFVRRLMTAGPAEPPAAAPQAETPLAPAASPGEGDELRRALAALEVRLAELEQRPATPDEVPREASPAMPSPEITARLDDLERRLSEALDRPAVASEPSPDLAARIDDLERRLTETANRPAVAPEVLESAASALETRLAHLEKSLADLSHRLDEQTATQAEAQSRRARGETLTLGSVLLREALARGAPFADALPPLRAALAEDPALAARLERLAPVAATGLPTRETLQARFAEQADDLLRPEDDAQPANGGFFARIWQQIRGLVTIRRVDDAAPLEAGSAPDRMVARAEARLAAGDLAGAVSALDLLAGQPALAPEAEASVENWLRDARLRLDAEALLTDLLARGLAVTSGSVPAGTNENSGTP